MSDPGIKKNLRNIHTTDLHALKHTVWCGVTSEGIIDLIYLKMIVEMQWQSSMSGIGSRSRIFASFGAAILDAGILAVKTILASAHAHI